MALPTAAEVRALMFPEISGTSEDAKLTIEIAAADAVCAAYCLFPPASAGASPTLEATSYTLYRNGPSPRDSRRLDLRLRPVTTITSIHVDDEGDLTYDAANLIAATEYVLDDLAGHVYLTPLSSTAWSSGLRKIKIIATAGYNVGATDALTMAIAQLVKAWRTGARKAGPTASSASSSGGASVQHSSPAQALPDAVLALLSPYVLYERMGAGGA